MKKLDLKKELKSFYSASKTGPTVVEVPEFQFLAVNGTGDPNTSTEFRQAVEALYSVSYTLKFTVKKGDPAIDYGVMPLQGLWWADDMSAFSQDDKSNWKWTAMIMQPDFISEDMVKAAIESVEKKKSLPGLSKIEFIRFAEGRSAQILHIGPYSEEGPTIERLHGFIKSEGGKLRGKHHEIYLSDPGRTAPEKLRTIIRQPFSRSQ